MRPNKKLHTPGAARTATPPGATRRHQRARACASPCRPAAARCLLARETPPPPAQSTGHERARLHNGTVEHIPDGDGHLCDRERHGELEEHARAQRVRRHGGTQPVSVRGTHTHTHMRPRGAASPPPRETHGADPRQPQPAGPCVAVKQAAKEAQRETDLCRVGADQLDHSFAFCVGGRHSAVCVWWSGGGG